jgi:hypothetical protein
VTIRYSSSREFDIEWTYGRPAELLVGELCGLADDGKIRLEVKRKRRGDGYFYVELEHDPGRQGTFSPSGLSTSKAEVWAIAVADSGSVFMTPAQHLRTAIERNYGFPAEETDGDCPTRGRLLHVLDALQAAWPGRPSRANFGDNFHVLA